jgi:leucyl/phenylalanyl-tRNA--protein transferase
MLLRAYASGLFPMAETSDSPDIFWVEPRRRGVLPLAEFHAPRSLMRTLRRDRFSFTHDRAFKRVMAECAAPAPDRDQTWINGVIADAYAALHAMGHAHSIEVWTEDGTLAGGLYGVRLGGAFFGESMFTRVTDGSKAALAALVVRLRLGGFRLLDTQFLTEHLARFGTREIDRRTYRAWLADALAVAGDFSALDAYEGGASPETPMAGVVAGVVAGIGSGALSGQRIAQLLTQTS